jgi:protein-L-isoaspartate(D-aspartate) O-methyltransferase
MSQVPPSDDFLNDARKRMVDSQLRPNKVSDPRILEAMRHLPRERFVPASLATLAYSDENVPLGGGRVLMQPMVIARLLQSALPMKGEKALVVGAGSGYAAALLASCGCAVTALEERGALADLARGVLAAVAPEVTIVTGPLATGCPAGAPYDVVLIEGAVPEIPNPIAAQLKPETGRLVTILSTGSHTGQAVLAEMTPAGLAVRTLFDALCPVIPTFAKVSAFAF